MKKRQTVAISVGQEQVMSTALTFAGGNPLFAFLRTGTSQTDMTLSQSLVQSAFDGSAWPAASGLAVLSSARLATQSGMAPVNYAMTGFNVTSVRGSSGNFASAYLEPNNWLYATTCGD